MEVGLVRKALDIDFLRNVLDSDSEFEKELFAIFLDNSRRNIDAMESAIKNSDDSSWYMAAHAFKGAAASIGAFDLSKILEYAQKHQEGHYEQKKVLLAKIKDELALVIKFINEELGVF